MERESDEDDMPIHLRLESNWLTTKPHAFGKLA
jgi:hypothetical protein